MWPYLAMTAMAAAGALGGTRFRRLPWFLMLTTLVLFVGLRHHVGMDWNNYLFKAVLVGAGGWKDSFEYAEPGYALLLWSSVKLGWGVYGANLVGALVFFAGLARFCRTLPSPWLALTVAMPILVIVVSMSANRQSVAIGILLWLTAVWGQKSMWQRAFQIFLASMFHFSASVFLLFLVTDSRLSYRNKLYAAAITVATFATFFVFTDVFSQYDAMYVRGGGELVVSPGAKLHVLVNGIPAALGLFSSVRFRKSVFSNTLLTQMAWLAVFLVPLSFVFSTASSRMTLYLFPVSIAFFASLPSFFSLGRREVLTAIISTFFVALSWFWLSFANNSPAHLPYQNILLLGAVPESFSQHNFG